MKKTSKKMLSLTLALCLALALLPTAALAADSDFEINSNGVLLKYTGPGGDVTIPSSVIKIGDRAFKDCAGLTSVTIPSSVTEIWERSFENCTGLTAIQVDAGNQAYISVDGVVYTRDRKTLVAYPGARQGAYTIPNSVTTIWTGAFSGCAGLTGVTIPSSVIEIDGFSFANCTGLTSVTIPGSVNCIYACAFTDCTGLTSVTISNGVSTIWMEAFAGCTGLTSLTIPGSVTSMGEGAFDSCTGLTSVTIANGATEIGMAAFLECTGLTSVTIPVSVTTIGDAAFGGCTALKDIYYGGSEAQWNAVKTSMSGDFRGDLANTTIHYNSAGPGQSTTPGQSTNLPTVENIPATGTAVARTQTVELDGKDVEFQCYAVKNAQGNETNYVKVRDLAQALNGTKAQFNVGWDGTISITANTAYQAVGGEGTTPYTGNQPYTSVSSTPVSFNGSSVNLTSFSITYQGGGYTYYKLRDLGQLLNFNVTWNGRVVVETDKPYTG